MKLRMISFKIGTKSINKRRLITPQLRNRFLRTSVTTDLRHMRPRTARTVFQRRSVAWGRRCRQKLTPFLSSTGGDFITGHSPGPPSHGTFDHLVTWNRSTSKDAMCESTKWSILADAHDWHIFGLSLNYQVRDIRLELKWFVLKTRMITWNLWPALCGRSAVTSTLNKTPLEFHCFHPDVYI